MGHGSFDPGAYAAYQTNTATQTRAQMFTSNNLHANLDPKKLNTKGEKIRESVDSADNPNSTPIIVALDVTGSMGRLAEVIARKGLGIVFNEILDLKPVTDPHLMFMGIGDARTDSAPLQVSQFEADNRIVEQLTQIFLEGGGGGNAGESYSLAWYFASKHCVIDSYTKRAKKGYLFTVGDEPAPPILTREEVEKFCGDKIEADLTPEQLLAEVQRQWEVFHIVIAEGDGHRMYGTAVIDTWQALLNERVINLPDHAKLAEVIVSTIQVLEGAAHDRIAQRYGGVVLDAVKHLPSIKQRPALTAGATA